MEQPGLTAITGVKGSITTLAIFSVKDFFIYLRGKMTESERVRESFYPLIHIQWAEPGIPSRFPMWVEGSHAPGPSSSTFSVALGMDQMGLKSVLLYGMPGSPAAAELCYSYDPQSTSAHFTLAMTWVV